MRKIYISKNIGFCYGVSRAIKIVRDTITNKDLQRPIYLLGSLIHNHYINLYLKNNNVIVLDGDTRDNLLNKIESGTVVFTAHGVSEAIKEKAINKCLNIVDATCPYVEKMFKAMEDKIKDNYHIIFIGKKSHPESEVAMSFYPNVTLYDENNLPDITGKIALCHQTTMSSYDINEAYQILINKYPNIEKLDMLCKITENRQQELKLFKNNNVPTLIIVVGDSISNNSTKLYEMAKRINNVDTIFVSSVNELNLDDLKIYQEIHLFSGTSTPKAIVEEIYNVLNNLDNIPKIKYESKLKLDDYIK